MPESAAFPWSLALVVLAYLGWKHKQLKLALEGTVKCLIGYYLVLIGARMTAETLGPVCALMQAAFSLRGGVMNSEVFGALLLDRCGALGLPTLFLSFLVNLSLARLLRAKGVYLTGHHSLYLALFTTAALQLFTDLSAPLAVLLGAALAGAWEYATVCLTAPVIRRVTGSPGTGMANSCAGAALLGAAVGRLFAGRDRYDADGGAARAGTGNVPVLAFAGTFAVYVLLCLIAGPADAAAILGSDRPWLLSCLVRSLLYAAQVTLLLHGIQLLIANLIALFWDLANRLVPGIWVGLDASALIGCAPRAWRAGFLGCTLGGAAAMAAAVLLRAPFVPLFSLTSFYFVGGVAGVCGNAYGGRRGAQAAGFVAGAASIALTAAMMARMGPLAGLGASFGETEYGLYGLILQWIGRLF